MGFYDGISAYYDSLFPVDSQVLHFLQRRIGANSRILDIACGTGGYSLTLARQGHRLIGIDLDRAMIEAARDKARNEDLEVSFKVLDMRAVAENLEGRFGLIFCIGNSLVHMRDDEDIARFFAGCYGLLESKASLVVQIINYDRILEKGITSLPTLKDERRGLEFARSYEVDRSAQMVLFRTELSVWKQDQPSAIRNEISLRILTSKRLVALVEQAGFEDIRLFGDFDERPFNTDTLALVMSAA